MIIVGEKLNSSIPSTLSALQAHDGDYLVGLIKKQEEAGADYLDINTSLTGTGEAENMKWVIKLALENSGCGIMLDSPNPEIIAECISAIQDRPVIVNSVTLDSKYDLLTEIIKKYSAGVVCMPISEGIIPGSAEGRLENALKLTNKLIEAGIERNKLYIDLIIEAIATNNSSATTAEDTLKLIKEKLSGVNTICGLSNISFGLPMRARINAALMYKMKFAGIDAVIADVTSERIREAITISDMLLGNDEYCIDYIGYFRSLGDKSLGDKSLGDK